MRIFITLLVFLSPVLLSAQWTRYQAQINLDPDSRKMEATVEVQFTNLTQQPIHTLHWEWWARALENPQSEYNLQLLEEQNTSVHFAEPDELGGFSNVHLIAFSQHLELGSARDTFRTALPKPIFPGDSAKVTWTFTHHLPEGKFGNHGIFKNHIWLEHILPRLALHPAGEQRAHPKRREADDWREKADYSLQIRLPQGHEAISNSGYPVREVQDSTHKTLWFELTQVYDPRVFVAHQLVFQPFSWYPPGTTDTLKIQAFSLPQHAAILNAHRATICGVLDHMYKRFLAQPGWTPVIVLAPEATAGASTESFYVVPPAMSSIDFGRNLSREYARVLFGERQGIDGYTHPWLVTGLAEHLSYDYLETAHPTYSLLGALGQNPLARLLDLHQRPILEQAYFLNLSTMRQGLDQPANLPTNAYPRLNYLAALFGKAPMHFHYLRDYLGPKDYYRSLRMYLEKSTDPSGSGLHEAVAHYSYKPTAWFFNALLPATGPMDFRLITSETCPTITTVTVRNRGGIQIPIPLTGLTTDSTELVEWLPPFSGKKSFNITHEPYQMLQLDAKGHLPENYRQNNEYKPNSWFPKTRPVRLQFFTTLENPNKTQVFWMPSLNYNAYDQLLVGARFTNSTILPKPIEWTVGPDFSTGTTSLTGYAAIAANILPKKGWFHRISAGIFTRYYHYDHNLAFFRLSPTIKFYFRKKNPRQEWFHTLTLRSIRVDRELEASSDEVFSINKASFTAHNVRWTFEQTKILNPVIAQYDFQASNDFIKHSITVDWRYMIIPKEWLQVRVFAGHLLHARSRSNGSFYSFGLSGVQDYLFDYELYGRSDTKGIWSQQFFVSDGGFKARSGVLSARWMTSLNLFVPLYRFCGLYADAALTDLGQGPVDFYGTGARLHLVPDFIELYFPLYQSNLNPFEQAGYFQQVRFVLNLDPDAIITRLRRGWF